MYPIQGTTKNIQTPEPKPVDTEYSKVSATVLNRITNQNLPLYSHPSAPRKDLQKLKEVFQPTDLINAITSLKKRQPSISEGQKCISDIEKMTFQEALKYVRKQEFSPSSRVYLALIKKTPSKIIHFFSQKIPQKYCNSYVVNALLNGFGKAGLFEEAKTLFEAAVIDRIANAVTYNSYIFACGETNHFKEAADTFKAAVTNGIANAVTYHSYISACRKNGYFKEADDAFQTSVKNGIATTDTCNSYISACGKTGHFIEADQAFEAAVNKGLADAVTCSIYIDIYKKMGNFKKVKEIFESAVESKIVDTVTYTLYLSFCVKTNHFKEAGKAFRSAVKNEMAKDITYNIYIDFCGKTNHFKEADETFRLAVENGIATAFTYGSYIDACGRTGHFIEADEAFKAAVNKGMASTVTKNIYIDICVKNGRFKEADEVFRTVTADSFSYSIYIDACGKNSHFQKASEIFKMAVENKMADAVVYNSYINFCGRNGQFEEAKKVFIRAVELQIANNATYHIYINLHLAQTNNILECKNFFKQGKLPLVKTMNADQKALDLHNFSHGSGIVAVDVCFEEHPDLFQLFVITGKGNLEDGNYLTFRDQLIIYIEKFLPWLELELDHVNEGRFLVRRCAEHPLEKEMTEFEKATETFNDAVRRGVATDLTYHTYCDAILGQEGLGLSQLTAVIKQGNLKPIRKNGPNDQKILDLTGFSCGSAVGTIAESFRLYPNIGILTVILGKGDSLLRAQLIKHIKRIPWLEWKLGDEQTTLYVRLRLQCPEK
jgi:pentatricopeptide repeat protein